MSNKPVFSSATIYVWLYLCKKENINKI